MGKIIGSSDSSNFGEKMFIEKAVEYLDDNYIIYWNRQVFGKEFDVCILMPNKGILVVELKGWKESNILRVDNSDKIVVNTDDGNIYVNPMKQARGYRFAIERRVRQSISKFPLIFSMVCLPQVSHAFYSQKRLDVVCEDSFTILKEDLKDQNAFFTKINQALTLANTWHRDQFDSKTMLEVRSLFETDIKLNNEPSSISKEEMEYHDHPYSKFYYVAPGHLGRFENEIVDEYLNGTKIYAVFGKPEELRILTTSIKKALRRKGLVVNGENIEILFEENGHSEVPFSGNSFTTFNCSLSSLSSVPAKVIESFTITDGNIPLEKENDIKVLSNLSQFNLEQFMVEHSDPSKNIIIKAGAGTGKTYTMISRIAFVCYTQNTSIQSMAERIVMITFTNEAADQMEDKLKNYFRNCYLLTSRREYLEIISKIDYMQISTIHSYAKSIIETLGTEFGYGVDINITSSEYSRRRKISDMLDNYIGQKKQIYGDAYIEKLGMPVYAIRDNILSFIEKLHNKSVDVPNISANSFGCINGDSSNQELHELLANIIPAVEKEYAKELLEENRIHLSTMMSALNRFVSAPESKKRIQELRNGNMQFMFVDEFQDTDDTQIATLLSIADLLDYKLFVVGDIKQCIYRFRGAKEKAFDQLPIKEHPEEWLEFSLKRNYRTDSALLDLFDKSFDKWGNSTDELLTYSQDDDRLLGSRDYNSYLKGKEASFYRNIQIDNENERIPALIKEIQRLQKRISYEESQGKKLSNKEKTIAILVRENWQAEMVRIECARQNITVQTNTGGDLYMSQPAIDMLTLVNALLHFNEADYLYSLVSSNFFSLDIPKANLYEKRQEIKKGAWRAKATEKDQVNYLVRFMNKKLTDIIGKDDDWEHIIASLRTKPVLQVIREIYSALEPWKNYSSNSWKQHYYQLNVDLLYEQLINSCNTDRLTISTLQNHLYNSIVAKVSVDSRIPGESAEQGLIQCITVHKSKGLEYGYIIVPFCSFAIDFIKRSQLHVSTLKDEKGDINIGYSLNVGETGKTVQNDYYNEVTEKTEKSREETRILYVAMTRAILSFSWIELQGKKAQTWQSLIEKLGE